MRVSAIVAVRNGANLLPAAIESILAQDPAPFETIVVDDGSTDATPELIRSFGTALRAFRRGPSGLAATHNFALEHATGDAIAFLDHDDLWPPGRLSAMVEPMQADGGIDIVAGKVQMRYERSDPPPEHILPRLVEAHRPYMMHSLLIRRHVFDRVGMFDERLTHAMDVDWYMRARDLGVCFRYVPDVTLIYRLHDTNMTKDIPAVFEGVLGAFKNALDRRRQST
jgi:glycosyltransferase involved in cell wall biosynthesis